MEKIVLTIIIVLSNIRKKKLKTYWIVLNFEKKNVQLNVIEQEKLSL